MIDVTVLLKLLSIDLLEQIILELNALTLQETDEQTTMDIIGINNQAKIEYGKRGE